MRIILSVFALASLCLPPLSAQAQDLDGFEARSLQGSKGLTLPYRLFKVKNPTAGTKYPLILFLHGAGERGDNNTSQLTANAGATVWATDAHQTKHPAYVIAPQCPGDKQWVDTDWTLGSYSTTTVPVSDQLTTALEIADAVATEFGTDPTRQYITGVSMGGYGTWDAIVRHPERFAAAIPICGAGDPTQAARIELLPLWTFHGDADTTVPIKGTRDMVAALQAVGSSIKYTEYPGVGHDAWDMTYANEEVIDWLFTFKKEAAAGGGNAGNGGSAGSSGGAGSSGSGGSASSAGGSSASSAGGSSGGSPPGSLSGGSAGAVAGGSAGSLAGPSGSGPLGAKPPGADSSCSFHPERSNDGGAANALALVAAAALARRRRSRAAA